MKLTKEQAVAEHRKMWRWLSEHQGKSKKDYLDEHGYDDIRTDCFCCEYAYQKYLSLLIGGECRYCPIKWPNGQCINCTVGCGLADCGLYINWKRTFDDGDYYKASFFASQIANLPEREDLEND